jgi:ABC-type Fe3+/spermidine/putrescine transport system ATPase subunit
VSLDVQEGKVVCLLGPSGCGKTTLLRIVAGLEAADGGIVRFEGRSLEGVSVHERGFGLMFQDFALFPHKDVAGNVAFGLRMQNLPAARVQARVAEMLDLVGLQGFAERRVYDLSGGEQQRVALARSLAPGPRLLMLDEPLGSLDRALREELLGELRAILKQVGVTTLYVTHDQQEAFALADRLVLIRDGQIQQRGAPQDVFRQPASTWVAGFLGLGNLVPGRVVSQEPLKVDTFLGPIELAETSWFSERPAPGQSVTILLRPDGVCPIAFSPEENEIMIEGTVVETLFQGSHLRVKLRHKKGPELTFHLSLQENQVPAIGQEIALAVHSQRIALVPEPEYAY